MKKYSIGLDLGINNVGWAIYDYETSKVKDQGVVRFAESSNAQDRRAFRGSRRRNKRARHRIERLAILLKNYGFNTERTYEPFLLEKRIKGLTNELSETDISNIIYYFAIHRGYIPFDDNDEAKPIDLCEYGFDYPCLYLKDFVDKYNKYRGEAKLVFHKDIIRELKAILLKQSEFNNKISLDFINDVVDIISSKREFWEGPGAAKPNQLSKYGRYRSIDDLEKYGQDPTYNKYLYEMLIGKCDLSVKPDGTKDNVAPICNYYAESFNFLNDFINISVVSTDLLTGDYLNKVDKHGKFTEETINEFREYVLSHKSIRFERMIEDILGTDINNIQGYRVDKNHKPEFSKYEFYKYIYDQFSTQGLDLSWIISSDKTIYNKVVYVLTVSPSAIALPDMLADRIKEKKFDAHEIEVLKNIKSKKGANLSYHSLSENLLIRSINDMKKDHYQFNYMQIMKKNQYEKEMNEYFNSTYSSKTKIPYIIEDKYVDELTANPQVKKTLRKAIKVINAIIRQEQDYPYAIVVESTKELNGKTAKSRIEREQKNNTNLRQKAEKVLEENGLQVSKKNIEKLILWQETNNKCIYCGKPISLKEAIATDVEHILPVSKTMDSSSDNLTCSCSTCNGRKGNSTPFEYLTRVNMWNGFKNSVESCLMMSEKKKENLLFTGNVEKYSIKFINRNLRDTAYGTTALLDELRKYNNFIKYKHGIDDGIRIISVPGQLTSRIRSNLELAEKDRSYLFHHAIDAMILASVADTRIGEVLIRAQNDSKYWASKDEEDRNIIYRYITDIGLKNINQIKNMSKNCNDQPEDNKDGLIKRSFEVLRNPVRKFADTNYSKFIKIDDNYYKIQSVNIYNIHTKEDKTKKLFDKLFDSNDKNYVLLCEKNDPTLFSKLKAIYVKNKNYDNPFIQECIYMNGLEDESQEFNYLVHGLRRNDDSKSIVARLRYITKVTNPFFKNNISTYKMNTNKEFINSRKKESTLVGLDSLDQVCTSIYYSYTDSKFVFLPIQAICFKDGKLDENNLFYKETRYKVLGDRDAKFISNVYRGEWIGFVDKNGIYKEGKFKGYHTTNKVLVYYSNGIDREMTIGTTASAIIIYNTDILGNRFVRLDTRKLL